MHKNITLMIVRINVKLHAFSYSVGTSATKHILQLIATMIAILRLLQFLQLSGTDDNQIINFIATFPRETSGNVNICITITCRYICLLSYLLFLQNI